jgi:lipopolysaccharide/colanic/teichoic acid biosynthesis glycosyltransferase
VILQPKQLFHLSDKTQTLDSNVPIYIFEREKVHTSVYSKTKRLIDIVGALLGLLITLAIAPVIAVAMQIDNPGPIFYSQIRCGLNGKPFRILKFRSMIVNADRQKHLVENQAKGHIFKNENDPRITRVGKFLRRTSLDELPQFWNVAIGEMSLVGTRPPTPDEVEKYEDRHYQRLKVRPGMTGEWQVKGRSNISDFEQIVEMDLDYQRKWNHLYDIYLIFMTINIVFARKGAY